MRRLIIGLDADEVVLECVTTALPIVNKRLGLNIKLEDITSWDFKEFPAEVKQCFEDIFNEEAFYKSQKAFPGAVEMVKKLVGKKHDVNFVSATYPKFMGLRSELLLKIFPMVPEKNILLGYRKDLVHLDILLDDGPHNIIKTRATYPVIFRRPWNESLTGYLSVENYDQFLALVDQIAKFEKPKREPGPSLIALVGPSGSGKTSIAKKLCENPAFGEALSHTTRKRRPEEGNDYHFIDAKTFFIMEDDFIETTFYAGNKYGLSKNEIDSLWNSGKHAVTPMDITGAMRLKKVYGDRALSVFIRRDKSEVLSEIISRDVSAEDKVRRIMSLETEYGNEDMCDIVVVNKGIGDGAAQIATYLMAS